MTATLQEAISCRGRVGADALGKSRLTDVADDGRVDEAVRQSDDQNGDNDNDGAEQAVAYDWRPHEADHHKAHAAHDGADKENHLGVLGAIDEARCVTARRQYTKPIQHHHLTDIFRAISGLTQNQRQSKGDDACEDRFGGRADGEQGFQEFQLGDDLFEVARQFFHRRAHTGGGSLAIGAGN